MIKKLRFAVLGCGFWSHYQIPAWLELEDVQLVALYNRTLGEATKLSQTHGPFRCYDDAVALFENEQLDFVDIITDPIVHAHFVKMAARYGVSVICQKPMATSLQEAREMVAACEAADVPYYIHENFRWQSPVRKLKELLDNDVIGKVFKARISFCSAFAVFDNQPFLRNLNDFIISDIGSHLFDLARFLFGEVSSLFALASSVNHGIQGEDVANILMRMKTGADCFVEMSYASMLEREAFPQTLIFVEGAKGSIRLGHDFELSVTNASGTSRVIAAPVHYPWAEPSYLLVHSSIVDCNRNILQDLKGTGRAETTGKDNFETVRLVWAAYESFRKRSVIEMEDFR